MCRVTVALALAAEGRADTPSVYILKWYIIHCCCNHVEMATITCKYYTLVTGAVKRSIPHSPSGLTPSTKHHDHHSKGHPLAPKRLEFGRGDIAPEWSAQDEATLVL